MPVPVPVPDPCPDFPGVSSSRGGIKYLARVRPWLTCVLVFSSHAAFAQTVEEGRQAYLEADFETSIATFEAVLQKPSLTRDEAADAHRYLTRLRTLQGQPDSARRHAELAVALDPSVDAPRGSPDEVAALFAAALEVTGGTPAQLTIEAAAPLREGERVAVRAHFAPSPEGLVETIELRCAAGGEPVSETGPPPEVEVVLEPSADARCRADALTTARAALASVRATLELESAAVVTAAVGATTNATETSEPSTRRAWPWVVVALVVVAAAVAVPLIIVRPFANDDPQLGTTRIEGW